MLVSRSSPECHLYIELHPCGCGEARLDTQSHTESRGADLVAVYTGACPACARARSFEFVLDPELPPAPPAFGGARPSQIICPGEFLDVADAAAKRAPAVISTLPPREQLAARLSLARAAEAMAEVIKFVPAGADRVPVEAFTSARGKRMYLAEPGRFRKLRLEAVLGVYRDGLAKAGGPS